MWLVSILGWHVGTPSVTYIFKTKVGGAFFLIWPCLIGYGLMQKSISGLARAARKDLLPIFLTILFSLGIITCSIFGIILLDSLLGLLVSIGLGVLMIIICLRYFTFSWLKNGLLLLVVMVIAIIIFLNLGNFFKTHSPQFQSKLVPLMLDVRKSLDTVQNRTWQRSPQVRGIPDPLNAAGQPVNGSTYERVSWLVEGARVFFANPLGTGYTSEAFHFYMSQNYPGSTVAKTHSGWLDIALGLGIPGLLLLWGVFGIVLHRAFIEPKAMHGGIRFIAIWALSGVWVLLWPAELGERDYIEVISFMLALFIGATLPTRDRNPFPIYYNK
jgi:hypothetical protein